MFPCKNLPTSSDFTFNQHRPDIRPQLRRRSGIPGLPRHMLGDRRNRTGKEFETQESKAVFISRQRRQLDSSPIGNNEVSSTTKWQQLSKMKFGGCWNEGDMSKFAVASDEAVSSKVPAAQQEQQRESMTKPIRQQSLPITPTSTNQSFGHQQSMAQILQQRRLQRRLKVAATTHQQRLSGYQLPLPEFEQLRIDNASAFGHLPNVPGSLGMESQPQNQFPVLQNNEHEWVRNGEIRQCSMTLL